MMIDSEKKEFGAWWLWVVFLLVISLPIFWALSAAGIIGRTIVEREIFEQSYQRSAAQQAKYNTLKAELASIESLLRGSSINETQRADMQAQAAAIRVQLSAME